MIPLSWGKGWLYPKGHSSSALSRVTQIKHAQSYNNLQQKRDWISQTDLAWISRSERGNVIKIGFEQTKNPRVKEKGKWLLKQGQINNHITDWMPGAMLPTSPAMWINSRSKGKGENMANYNQTSIDFSWAPMEWMEWELCWICAMNQVKLGL